MKDKHLSLLERSTETSASGKRRMHPDMAEALNQQLRLEMESAYLYFGMATYFKNQDLDGFASWFSAQAKEEMEHAMRVYHYLLDRGADIALPALPAPELTYNSHAHAFACGLEHEQVISLKVNELYGMAQRLGEFDTAVFLQWFLNEQVEEEALFSNIVQQLKRIEKSGDLAPLLMLDRELGSRTEASTHS